jgi:hypothetical protein
MADDTTIKDDSARMRTAFMKRQKEIDAVPAAHLVPLNIDVELAVTTVLGALKLIAPYKDHAKKLPELDTACFDNIEDYTLAVTRTR